MGIHLCDPAVRFCSRKAAGLSERRNGFVQSLYAPSGDDTSLSVTFLLNSGDP